MTSAVLSASALLLQPKTSSVFFPTGIASFDQSWHGIPRGAITEIRGSRSTGRTSFLMSSLVQATSRGEACALADASDRFHPESAARSGVVLGNLIWMRCSGDAGAALKVTDILLHGGGFGWICLDLCDVPARDLNRLPASYWYRFRRAIENTHTILLVLTEYPTVRSCALCTVECAQEGIQWSGAANARLLQGIQSGIALRKPVRPAVSFFARAYPGAQ